nr:zinc knuckle CX2CX4HX4C [Tanacetum cinerariifolium]
MLKKIDEILKRIEQLRRLEEYVGGHLKTINARMFKENITKVPMWVKLQNVPVAAFNADGLSFIATKLGELLILDLIYQFYDVVLMSSSVDSGDFKRMLRVMSWEIILRWEILLWIIILTQEFCPKKDAGFVNDDDEVVNIYDETTGFVASSSQEVGQTCQESCGGSTSAFMMCRCA